MTTRSSIFILCALLICMPTLVSVGQPAFSSTPLAPAGGQSLPGGPPVVYLAGHGVAPFRIAAPAFPATARAQSATFTVNYLPAGSHNVYGDTCDAWPTAARTVFSYAANIWGHLLTSSVPIVIRACWASNLPSGVLGHSAVASFHRDFAGAPQSGTWYGAALANALAGSDLNDNDGQDWDGDGKDADAEMEMAYASTGTPWYYGTDGNTPMGQYDLVSVVLHEIAHGLDFAGTMTVSSGVGSWGVGMESDIYPRIYDRFTRDGNGIGLISTAAYPNPSVALGDALRGQVGGGVYFQGANAMAANGGNWVKLYSPSVWQGGSSYAHLDEIYDWTVNALMTYALDDGEANHNPGPITCGLLRDLGWPGGCSGTAETPTPAPTRTATRTLTPTRTPFSPTPTRGTGADVGKAYLGVILRGWSPDASTPTTTPSATTLPSLSPTPNNTPTATGTATSTDTPTPQPTALQSATLYLHPRGLLRAAPYPGTAIHVTTCYTGNCTDRWMAVLAGDMVGNSYGVSGKIVFTSGSAYTAHFRFILSHQGVEQVLAEYPLAVPSGTDTFHGFHITGLDLLAVAGDNLILEIDRSGSLPPTRLEISMGGTEGVSVEVPAVAIGPDPTSTPTLTQTPTRTLTPTPTGAWFVGHVVAGGFDYASSVQAADLDADGGVDILAASGSTQEVAWWENDGQQAFTRHNLLSGLASGSSAGSAYAADLDGDGDTDILATVPPGYVLWWENIGNRSFISHTISSLNGVTSIYAVDLDHDGDLDVTTGGSGVVWWENDGQQHFARHTVASGTYPSVYPCDLDRDGDMDLLVSEGGQGTVSWWENDGQQNWTKHTIKQRDTYASADSAVYAADLDGDGDTDVLASAYVSGELAWWENDGQQRFTEHILASGSYNTGAVYAADLDGDGDVDILNGRSAVYWWENDGHRGFIQHYIGGSTFGARSLFAADVDGDSHMDVLSAGWWDGRITWWENQQ